jgi:hypothetical protein
MDKQALGAAIAGGAIGIALIEAMFDRGTLTLDEARNILTGAMRAVGPYAQTEGGYVASNMIGDLLRGKFSARERTP